MLAADWIVCRKSLRGDLVQIYRRMTTSFTFKSFKCVHTFRGSLTIHIFNVLFRLISESSWECKGAFTRHLFWARHS